MEPMLLKGRCECRACAFQIAAGDARRLDVVECHCPSCRKHAGAAFAVWLPAGLVDAPAATAGAWPRLTWVGERTPARIRASCSGHDGLAVDKHVCPACFSILALEPLDGSGAIEANLGCVGALMRTPCAPTSASPIARRSLLCIALTALRRCVEDGDYEDATAGRVANEDLWPSGMHLEKKERCGNTRARWYGARPNCGAKARGPLDEIKAVSGGCLCGANRFEILTGLSEMQHCHCSQCRRLGGAPFVTWSPIKEEEFRWTTASQALVKVRTSSEACRLACSACATTLQMVYDWQAGTVWPAVGSMDDSSLPATEAEVEHAMQRVVHICIKSKAPWVNLPADHSERLDYAFE